MSEFDLNKLMNDSKNPQDVLLEQTRGLVNKWDGTGLLDKLSNRVEKSGMAVMLENQAKQLVTEASATGQLSNSEQWSGVALPLVRRIFGEIAAKEFVAVQPMNLPSGLVFYMDFKYGTAQAGQPSFQGESVFGTSGSLSFGQTGDTTGGLYGPGRFGYTINDSTTASLAVTTGSVAWGDVNFSTALSSSVGDLQTLTVSMGAGARYDPEGVRAFTVSCSVGQELFYPEYTTTDASAYTIRFITSGSITASATATVAYHRQPTDSTRGDFEDTSGASMTDIDIPEINLELRSTPIVAKTRKLKAIWTPELAQDLNAYHSIDAEAELTSMLSEYISLEIDLEILEMLQRNALTTDYWTAKVGYEYNSAAGIFQADSNAVAASAYTKGSWFQTLGNKVQAVSNKIHQLTMRGGANFLVCSPTVATIIESIPGFAGNTDGDQRSFPMGVSQVGSLKNRWTVWKNPYMTENVILLGFKGSSFLETGAVYAPYVPLILTPLVYDPTNFTPRRGVMTRYAKKMVRPEYYGKIVIADVNLV